jgi:hypothetical protein
MQKGQLARATSPAGTIGTRSLGRGGGNLSEGVAAEAWMSDGSTHRTETTAFHFKTPNAEAPDMLQLPRRRLSRPALLRPRVQNAATSSCQRACGTRVWRTAALRGGPFLWSCNEF